MKIISGHLTTSDKKAIKAILDIGLNSGKVGKKKYFLTEEKGIYTVKYQQKDRGLIQCGGSELRISTYSAKFTI